MKERFIGIRHRTKRTVAGEARPTELVILEEGAKPRSVSLKTEDDELDFLRGRLPLTWRTLSEGEEVPDGTLKHHVKSEDGVRTIPATYDGFRQGDVVGIVSGGSGRILAFALSRRAEELGGETMVMGIPTGKLKDARKGSGSESDKDNDAALLAKLIGDEPGLFRTVVRRDRDLIRVQLLWREREEVMQQRIAAEQRLRQRGIGAVFCNEEGRYPEGRLEDAFKASRGNSTLIKGLEREEGELKKELQAALESLPVYTEYLSKIEGMGPLIAARILAGIGDIRPFVRPNPYAEEIDDLRRQAAAAKISGHYEDDLAEVRGRYPDHDEYQLLQAVRSWKRVHGKEAEALELDRAIACRERVRKLCWQHRQKELSGFKAYCGVHVIQDDDGRSVLPRRRRAGNGSGWNRDARQGLYLFVADQCNKRPESFWGKELRRYKAQFRAKHPDVVRNGKMRLYTDGHIHRMGIWRTVTRFAEALFRAWRKLEGLDGPAARRTPKTSRPAPSVDPVVTAADSAA